MEEQEEKGFVVKDRRKVSSDASAQESAPEPNRKEKAQEKEASAKAQFEEASRKEQNKGQGPLPAVAFSTFIFSLSSSALVHLGEIPEPNTQERRVDLPMAKQIIDTLGLLEEKTRGNLESDEERLLKSVLYDLRLRFVQKSSKQP